MKGMTSEAEVWRRGYYDPERCQVKERCMRACFNLYQETIYSGLPAPTTCERRTIH